MTPDKTGDVDLGVVQRMGIAMLARFVDEETVHQLLAASKHTMALVQSTAKELRLGHQVLVAKVDALERQQAALVDALERAHTTKEAST